MTSASSNKSSLYQKLDDYPWQADAEFQSGLEAIIGSHPFPEQAERLTLQAKCFYYARAFDIAVDFEGYKAYRAQHISTQPVNGAQPPSTAPEEPPSDTSAASSTAIDDVSPPGLSKPASEPPTPYPTSFSQIIELITNGQPILGVKEVPDTLLSGQESQPTNAKRRKPWEKEETGNTDISWASGSNNKSAAPG